MTGMKTMTLTEFLLARIAEDEAGARRAAHQKVAGPLIGWHADSLWMSRLPIEVSEREHIARHDPVRIVAECEAKRRVVEAHPLVSDPRRLQPVHSGPTPGVACETCGGNPVDSASPLEDIGPCDTLLALALPYADHPDYREEWRP